MQDELQRLIDRIVKEHKSQANGFDWTLINDQNTPYCSAARAYLQSGGYIQDDKNNLNRTFLSQKGWAYSTFAEMAADFTTSRTKAQLDLINAENAKKTYQVSRFNPRLTVAISLLALSVSFLGYYTSNYKIVHTLNVIPAVVAVETRNNDTVIPRFRFVYQNLGNRSETILSMFYGYFNENEPSKTSFGKIVDTPFIIKPGEVVTKDYDFTFIISQSHSNTASNLYQLTISHRLVNKNGEITTNQDRILDMRVTQALDASGHLEYRHSENAFSDKKTIKLIEN